MLPDQVIPKAALTRHLGGIGGPVHEGGQIAVGARRQGAVDVRGIFQSGEEHAADLGAWHRFLAVAAGDVAGPEAEMVDALLCFRAEVDDGVAVLGGADGIAPEDLHEVAGERRAEIGEVGAEAQFVKQSGGAGTVRIPASPDAGTVGLSGGSEYRRDLRREGEFSRGLESGECLQKDQVSGPRAVARDGAGGINLKAAIRSGDCLVQCAVRGGGGGVASFDRHLPHGFKDKAIHERKGVVIRVQWIHETGSHRQYPHDP